jgi:hypothetical protein
MLGKGSLTPKILRQLKNVDIHIISTSDRPNGIGE